MIRIISCSIAHPALFLCLLLFGQINLASAASVKMLQVMSIAQNNLINKKIECSLSGEDLQGLGSMEITVHFPAGSLVNPQVVFDSSFQGDTAAAQANVALPGVLRIGAIDAAGFTTNSGEIARISFDISENASQDVKLSADVTITDLQGKRVDSSIYIESVALHVEKPENSIEDELTEDSTLMPLGLSRPTTHASEVNSSPSIGGKEGLHRQNQTKTDALYAVSEPADRMLYSREYSSNIKQRLDSHTSDKEQSEIRKVRLGTVPVAYKIRKIIEEDQLYEVIVDLSGQNFNFSLSNGTILKIVKTNGMAKLTIKAGKRCMLYLIGNKITKVLIG